MKPSMLWITSDWRTLDHPRDTSLRLMEAAVKLSIPTSWAAARSIHTDTGGQVYVRAKRLIAVDPKRSKDGFVFDKPKIARIGQFESIQFRVDPPVDVSYMNLLRLLLAGVEAEQQKNPSSTMLEIVNPPNILLKSTSKLEMIRMSGFAPCSVISSEWRLLYEFGKARHVTVAKPLHKCNRSGVRTLHWETHSAVKHSRKALQHLSKGFTDPILLQQCVGSSADREVRYWYLDGCLIASICRVCDEGRPPHEQFVSHRMNHEEKILSRKIGKHLVDRGIRLAAVDVLNGFVLEVNFASPGLLVEAEVALGKNLADEVVQKLAFVRRRTEP